MSNCATLDCGREAAIRFDAEYCRPCASALLEARPHHPACGCGTCIERVMLVYQEASAKAQKERDDARVLMLAYIDAEDYWRPSTEAEKAAKDRVLTALRKLLQDEVTEVGSLNALERKVR